MSKQKIKILKPIVLIGLMGAGKSTVGVRLARRLNMSFIDTDNKVQEEVGCSIKEMVKYAGEEFFKTKEREVIKNVLETQTCVISTGGGAFIDDHNRDLIKKKAISVWLKAEYNVILERVSRRNTRPMLEHADKEGIVQKLINEYYPIYAEADIVVNSDDGSHMVIVDSIVSSLLTLKK